MSAKILIKTADGNQGRMRAPPSGLWPQGAMRNHSRLRPRVN
jgi:hypothetical protein